MRTQAPVLIAVAIAVTITLALAQGAYATETRVIIINGSGSHKRKIEASPDTKIINLKESKPKSDEVPSKPSRDVCSTFGSRFYCAHVGSTAIEIATGEPLGEIIGVLWKGDNEAVTRYLPPDWLVREEGGVFEINSPAGGEGFFYIVKGLGRLTFMLECARVSPEKN